MIRDTISEIEARLKNAGTLNEESKRELSALLAKLKTEITELARTDAEKASSIADLARTSTQEAIRPEKNPEQLERSVSNLASSVEGFEESHPALVQIVNRICTTLSNLGI